MTKAKFKFHKSLFQSFDISGHAEYNDEGLDIVCAGISATVITSLNLLSSLLKKSIKVSENEVEGYIHAEIINYDFDSKTLDFMHLVVDNLIASLSEIESMYPNHLKVKIEK